MSHFSNGMEPTNVNFVSVDINGSILSNDENHKDISQGDIEPNASFGNCDKYVHPSFDYVDSQSTVLENGYQEGNNPTPGVLEPNNVSVVSADIKRPIASHDENDQYICYADNVKPNPSLTIENPEITSVPNLTTDCTNVDNSDTNNVEPGNVEPGNLEGPPCISDSAQSIEDVSEWVSNMMSYLHKTWKV